VTLRAAPAAGWRFARWANGCERSNPCALTMRSDRAVSALFEERPGPGRVHIAGSAVLTRRRSARFTFRTSPEGRATRCALVRRHRQGFPAPRFASCASPKRYVHLKPGRYVFYVRTAGGAAHQAKRAFSVS
jgi:hypothetical protein